MPVTVGEEEEQTLHFDALAGLKKRGQQPWTQVGQALEYQVERVEALLVGKLVQGFEDRPFGRGLLERPLPRRRRLRRSGLEIGILDARPPGAQQLPAAELEPSV